MEKPVQEPQGGVGLGVDPPIKPRLNSSSNVALEKLKRRATTIRSFSSSLLTESLNGSVLLSSTSVEPLSPVEPPTSRNSANPLFTIRRSNSTRNRLSMPLEKLLEVGRSDMSFIQDRKEPLAKNNTEILTEEPGQLLPSNSDTGASGAGEVTISAESQEESQEQPFLSLKRLYLQLDNKVKKTTYNGPLTIASLKMLFVEKFQYNPGPYQFPDLYIKDPIIDVYYELEDLSEVREGSVLQLNVSVSSNALKKNMDSNFSTMVMEIRDLRRLMTQSNEVSRKQSNRMSLALPGSSRFSDLVKLAVSKSKETETAQSTTSTKPQYDLSPLLRELVTLRQDLSIVRQASNDFQKESQDAISHITKLSTSFNDQLKSETDSMHRLLASGKDRMENNAIDLANMLEDIQKNVEDFRQDLVQRRCQPSALRMNHTQKLLEKVNQTLLSESEFLSEVKPTWKKTWEAMLQDIVKEQQMLKEHESIIEDMRADHEHLTQTFQQLQQLMELKKKARTSRRSFDVEPADEELARSSLLQEIELVETDSDRRLRAFEEARQAREWELKNTVSPFEEELNDFVGSSKLRKTGGTEELDKKRRQQDEENLKAMLAPRPKPPSSRPARRPKSPKAPKAPTSP